MPKDIMAHSKLLYLLSLLEQGLKDVMRFLTHCESLSQYSNKRQDEKKKKYQVYFIKLICDMGASRMKT